MRTQWPGSPWLQGLTDVGGARGVAAPVARTGQRRHESTQKEKKSGVGPQNLRTKTAPTAGRREQPLRERADPQWARRAWPTAGSQPPVKETGDNHQSCQDFPDTAHSTRSWRRQVRRNAGTGPDSPDCAQSLEAWQLQFIEEDIEILVSKKRQPRFRRSWRKGKGGGRGGSKGRGGEEVASKGEGRGFRKGVGFGKGGWLRKERVLRKGELRKEEL